MNLTQALDLIDKIKQGAIEDAEYLERKLDKVSTDHEMRFDTGRRFQNNRQLELINEAEK